MTRNTLPFTAGHLHPRVGPPLIIIERLSHRIGALTFLSVSIINPSGACASGAHWVISLPREIQCRP